MRIETRIPKAGMTGTLVGIVRLQFVTRCAFKKIRYVGVEAQCERLRVRGTVRVINVGEVLGEMLEWFCKGRYVSDCKIECEGPEWQRLTKL